MQKNIGSSKEIIALIGGVFLLLLLLVIAGILLVQRNSDRASAVPEPQAVAVMSTGSPVIPTMRLTPTPPPTATPTLPLTSTPTMPPRNTPTTTPTAPSFTSGPPIAQITNGGNLRDRPDRAGSMVYGQVCPGDQVAVMGEQDIGQDRWYYIYITNLGGNCHPQRVPVDTSGWLNSSLVSSPSYPVADYLEHEITAVIYRNIAAANNEDLDAYMDTIHPESLFYNSTRRTISWMFKTYDLDYQLSGVELEGQTDQEARVAFVIFTRKLRGPDFRNNQLTGVFILQPYAGLWKIYDQEITNIEYIEEVRPL